MPKIHIQVGEKSYQVQVVDTPEDREKGLQGVTTLPDDEGMLFVFDEPQPVSFWMKDTDIPLDIIYIDAYAEVTNVFEGEPNSEEMLEGDGVKYVLEVNMGSGIEIGDEVEGLPGAEDEGDTEDYNEPDLGIKIPMDAEGNPVPQAKMVVLGERGKPQMELKGGERIFSRPNTKTLVRLAKRAYKSKDEGDYKALGRRVFKYLHVQNTKEDEYVDLPDKDK